MPAKDLCPCCSGRPYRDCCEPYHTGQREAFAAEALMRSRYSGFAKKQVDYLWRTLHAEHEDRGRGEAEVKSQLRDSIRSFKYMGLTILETRSPDGEGIARVLFLARIFEKGREGSFVELSEFAHDGVGWRYLGGEPVLVARLRADPEKLTIDGFRAAAGARAR